MTCLLKTAITTAATINGSTFVVGYRRGVRGLSMQVAFTTTSGGTNCDVKVQTSLDGGGTWIDVWHCTQFATTSGRRAASLMFAANEADFDAAGVLSATALKSIMGGHLRATVTSTGTYAGTTVQVDVFTEDLTLA